MKRKALSSLFVAAFLFSAVFAFNTHAAVTERDVLIKGSGDAVYYLANDGKRYVFPNQRIYESWFSDFEGVLEISGDDLASFMIGGNVTYRPGVRMVKITTDPKVYTVGKGGLLHWVTNEEVALQLYGSDWNTKIDDVPDAFFFNYSFGDPVLSISDYDPDLEAASATTINSDKGISESVGARESNTIVERGDAGAYEGFEDLAPTTLTNKEIIDKVSPSIVYIETADFCGSGSVISSDGTVLTNAHVVEGFSTATVKYNDGTTLTASVVGRDENVDLAILRPIVSSATWPTLTVASSDLAEPGDDVFIFGFPFCIGDATPSFKEGTVSREFVDADDSTLYYLETSAEFHSGNSGGAMVNNYGVLVGVPSFSLGQSIAGISVDSIRFAISAETVNTYSPLLSAGRNVGTDTGVPTSPPPPLSTCTEDIWSCGGYESCTESGTQSRSCWISSECSGVNTPSPTLVQTCTYVPPAPSCTADVWECGDWDACSESGEQSRSCWISSDCSGVSTQSPTTTQSCTPPVPGTIGASVAPSDSESEAGNLVGGTSNSVLGKWKLTAMNEELKLSKARFTTATPSGVSSMSLYDGSTLVGGPTTVNISGQADFSNVNFVIPKDASKTLTLKGDLSIVGPGGVASGSEITATLSNDASTFEIRGTAAGSSTLITTLASSIVGNVKILRKSKPTVTPVALPTTTLSAGDQVVLRFTVQADAAGDVAFQQLKASVVKSGTVTVAAAAAGSTLKLVGGSWIGLDTVTFAANELLLDLSNEEVVAAGTSKTYEVYAGLTGAVANDSVSSKLQSDTASTTANFAITAAQTATENFVWSDMSVVGHDETTSDWTGGLYIKNLPTDSQTLVK